MEKNNSKTYTDDFIIHQCNLVHGAEHHGYQGEGNVRDLVDQMLNESLPTDHPIYNALLQYEKVRKVFIKHLQKTSKPIFFGISVNWRKTQAEWIEATLKSLDRGYIRLVSEIPCGVGKSLVEGALVRAALDTMKELGLNQEIHIITSRVAIAGQLIYEEIPEDEKLDMPLEMGKAGDVRIWCSELDESQIRLLAGERGSRKKELEKDSILTISTYQGLRIGRIIDYFKKPVFMVICDESHRVTERITMLLEQMKASLVFGASATVLGPDRDPFTFFERIERPDIVKDGKTYIDHLCYYKSIAEAIKDGELKPIRWINAKTQINVSEAKVTPGRGVYDVFNNLSVARLLARKPELVAKIISEAYLGDHAGLMLSGSKPLWKRRGLVSVDRVSTAIDCSNLCNETLPDEIKQKFGEGAFFKAGFVHGEMKEEEYNSIINAFKAGEITLLFSVEKIGEGINLPFVNLIFLSRVLGLGSQWKLKQFLFRGGRIDYDDPTGDLAVVDLVFESDRHLLASVLGIFGRSTLLSGGLLVGWGNSYELEKKIIELLRTCKSITELWNKLTPAEQELFPFLRDKVIEEALRSGRTGEPHKHVYDGDDIFRLDNIEFIERDDVTFAMSLGNPEEMAKFTMRTLIKEGYDSIEKLNGVRDSSLHLFSRRPLGRFRDGLTMVNLSLQRNDTVLTTSNMSSFIALMRKTGLPLGRILIRREETPTVVNKPVKRMIDDTENSGQIKQRKAAERSPLFRKLAKVSGSADSVRILMDVCTDLFGVKPKIEVRTKDFFTKANSHTAQAFIILPDGIKRSSLVRVSEDEEVAKSDCAAELEKTIDDLISKKQTTLYRGSPLFSSYLKILPVIIHEQCLGDVAFTTVAEADGIMAMHAIVETKKKRIVVGSLSFHRDDSVLQQFASVNLCIELLKVFPEYLKSAPFVTTSFKSELETLCKSRKLDFKSEHAEIQLKNSKICKVTLTCTIYKKVGFGIDRAGAMEKASAEMLSELRKFSN